jgi:arylsulfatase A
LASGIWVSVTNIYPHEPDLIIILVLTPILFIPGRETRDNFDIVLEIGVPYSVDMGSIKDGPCADQNCTNLPLMRNHFVTQQPVDLKELSPRYAREATSFIQRHAQHNRSDDHPFFLMLAFSHAHVSVPKHLQWCSDAFSGRSAHGPYGDAVEEMDWVAGSVMNTIREEGIDKNTIG